MGGTNQETWKQPPASLNVEWPSNNTSRSGPTLEEQAARMRETRAKLYNAIAGSGQPVPRWPEVGQPVNWISSQHAFQHERRTDSRVTTGGQANQLASSRIPLRYQTSSTNANTPKPHLLARGAGSPTAKSLQRSPLSCLKARRRTKSEQPATANPAMEKFDRLVQAKTKLLKPKPLELVKATRDHDDLPGDVDPSILSPRVFVVELPDHVFQRTPPIAPRAMLEQWSQLSGSRQPGRGRRNSETTASSYRSYETTGSRARACSSVTTNTGHSFEPVLPDCNDCKEPTESLEEDSPEAMSTGTQQDSNKPNNLNPPPGFTSHQLSRLAWNIPPSPGFENAFGEFDASTGTWSYSKTWISEEERLRISFMRMQESAQHAGLDKSPFLPQSASEYAALLSEKKASAARRMRKKIRHSEEATQNRHDGVETDTTMPPVQNLGLFWGRKTKDGLSSVLAMESCFNSAPNAPEHARVDWPPSSEFRSWKASRPPSGTRWRSDSHCGPWPFPRVNLPFRPDETFEGEIPYNKRKIVFSPRWDWAPRFVKTQDDESSLQTQEISMTWLFVANPFLADLVQEIRARPSQKQSAV